MARPATSSLRRVKLLWAAGLLALAVLCPSQRASARVIAATPAGGLAGALAQAHAGDTIELAPGTYREQDLVLRQSGVRILGAGATLAGPGVGAGANGLSVEGADKIAISGLTISGFDWGLLLDSGSQISLRRLTITGNETGLRATGGSDSGAVSGLLVSHLRSEHNRLLGFDCSPGPCNGLRIDHSSFSYNGADNDTAADGVGFEPGSANIRVTASRAIGNAGDGFDFKARNVAVIGSRAQDNRRNGIKLWQGGKIVNSVSTGNGLAGLVLEPDPSFGRVRFLVENSLFSGNGFAGGGDYGEYAGLDGGSERLVLRNDVFALNYSAFAFGDGVELVEDHNLFFNPNRDYELDWHGRTFSADEIRSGAWSRATGGQGGGDLLADPQLGENLQPAPSSPAIDAGSRRGAPRRDIDGRRRPRGHGVDLGPFEIR